jgi:hypothetical protein
MSQEVSSEYPERGHGVGLLKRLRDISEKKPRIETPLTVNTDIYSLPPTSRRIRQQPRPMK